MTWKQRTGGLYLAVLKNHLSEQLQVVNTHKQTAKQLSYAFYSNRNMFMVIV